MPNHWAFFAGIRGYGLRLGKWRGPESRLAKWHKSCIKSRDTDERGAVMLMMRHDNFLDYEAPLTGGAAPSGCLGLSEEFGQFIEDELDYPGLDRFICLYYEPRAQRVNWRDGRSCGSGSRGWSGWFGQVQALARTMGMSVGNNDEPGDHVLLVDRVGQQARFAFREEAQEFLARRVFGPQSQVLTVD